MHRCLPVGQLAHQQVQELAVLSNVVLGVQAWRWRRWMS